MKRTTLLLVILLIITSCTPFSYQALFIESHPRTDTKDRPINYQTKQEVSIRKLQISVDNQFDGARMNGCRLLNDSTIQVRILPENVPVNESPWYAFRISSQVAQRIWIQLDYTGAKHRYWPKYSYNLANWDKVDSENLIMLNKDSSALFAVDLRPESTWIAGQEIMNSDGNFFWMGKEANQNGLEIRQYGTSVLGRPLYYFDMNTGKKSKKPVIVLLSRQHPPEITGYLAFRSFFDRIMDNSAGSVWLRKNFRILVYPMVNPDGVDLGNWRHNSGGVDLNRDWGSYRQPEIRQLCDHIVTESRKHHSPVVLGIDFHSTQHDIFYTNSRPEEAQNYQIASAWLSLLDQMLPDENLVIEPSWIRPVSTSKNWFAAELGADGITYEVGDEDPRDYIAHKAILAADALIQVLQKTQIK